MARSVHIAILLCKQRGAPQVAGITGFDGTHTAPLMFSAGPLVHESRLPGLN